MRSVHGFDCKMRMQTRPKGASCSRLRWGQDEPAAHVEYTATSPLIPSTEWLRAFPVEHARTLIERGELTPASELAGAVGLSRSSFGRICRGITGRSPGQDLG